MSELKLPPGTLELIGDIVYYQNEQLIKYIAKIKNWDETKLLSEFLVPKDKKFNTNINADKESNLLDINNMNNNIIETTILKNTIIKKKRGRPKKILSENEDKKVPDIDVKKRGRPSKIKVENEENKTIRKRGRPKKNIESAVVIDSSEDLEEETDSKSSKTIEEHDKIYNEKKEQELKEALLKNDLFEDCNSNSNLELHVNELSDDSNSTGSIVDSENDDNIEYEEITCELIKYKGKEYLKDKCTNNIYSYDSENKFVGKYNSLDCIIDFDAFE